MIPVSRALLSMALAVYEKPIEAPHEHRVARREIMNFQPLTYGEKISPERRAAYEHVYQILQDHHKLWRLAFDRLTEARQRSFNPIFYQYKSKLKTASSPPKYEYAQSVFMPKGIEEFTNLSKLENTKLPVYWIAMNEILRLSDDYKIDRKQTASIVEISKKHLQNLELFKYITTLKNLSNRERARIKDSGEEEDLEAFKKEVILEYEKLGFKASPLQVSDQDLIVLNSEEKFALHLGLFQESGPSNYWMNIDHLFNELHKLSKLIFLFNEKLSNEAKIEIHSIPHILMHDKLFGHRQWLYQRFVALEALLDQGRESTLFALELLLNSELN